MARALINVPPKAKRGEIIEIKTLISHIMETGFRHDNIGKPIPRDIITAFVCTYNGEEIFRAELYPAIAANPFITFFTVATESGTLEFEWTGDNGFAATEHRRRSPSNDSLGASDWLPPSLLSCRGCCPLSPPKFRSTERRSGYDFMSRETRAMQDDDTANPGMLWVLDGEALWKRKAGAAGKSCADCHGDAQASMKGVAARYPAFNAARGRPVDLEQRINICRTDQQQGDAACRSRARSCWRSRPMSAHAVARHADRRRRRRARLRPFHRSRPRRCSTQRQGQLNLSCAQCHDDNWGKQLAGAPIPQAHPTGYPIYRLEWQSLGSLQRRLRNCLIGMRAEPYAYGAPEYVDLELFLMWRARGMTIETPAVRP